MKGCGGSRLPDSGSRPVDVVPHVAVPIPMLPVRTGDRFPFSRVGDLCPPVLKRIAECESGLDNCCPALVGITDSALAVHNPVQALTDIVVSVIVPESGIMPRRAAAGQKDGCRQQPCRQIRSQAVYVVSFHCRISAKATGPTRTGALLRSVRKNRRPALPGHRKAETLKCSRTKDGYGDTSVEPGIQIYKKIAIIMRCRPIKIHAEAVYGNPCPRRQTFRAWSATCPDSEGRHCLHRAFPDAAFRDMEDRHGAVIFLPDRNFSVPRFFFRLISTTLQHPIPQLPEL